MRMKKMIIFYIIIILVSGCTIFYNPWEETTYNTDPQSTPNPTGETADSPTPEPTPDPTPNPTPDPTPGPPVTLQAEDAYYDNAVVETEQSGYTGTGYVNTADEVGTYIEWSFSTSEEGSAECIFTYANVGDSRPMELTVNGSIAVASLDFPDTGGWSTWGTVNASVSLVSVNNYVRLTSLDANGAPNLDKLDIIFSGTISPPVQIITNMVVYDTINEAYWSIMTNIRENDLIFGDRGYLISTLPYEYAGRNWIRTAADSKNYEDPTLVTFTVIADAEVLIAHDDRITTKPDWLTSDWTDTGNDMTDDLGVIYSIFTRSYTADSTVSLGPNGQRNDCIGYSIIVK